MRPVESPHTHTAAYLLIQRGFIKMDADPDPFRAESLLKGRKSTKVCFCCSGIVAEMLNIGPRSRQNNIVVPGSAR